MGGISESCRAMERNMYWNELELTNHKFFKIMASDFRTQLRIPRKFTNNFREELPKTISLRGPSDSIWRVRLARANGDMILCSGWNEFVEDHNVSEMDFLVFHYAGNATFSVSIFDMSGSEREGSYFARMHKQSCSNGSCVLNRKDREGPLMKLEKEYVEDTKLGRRRGEGIVKSVGSNGTERGKARVEEPAENDTEGSVSEDQSARKKKRLESEAGREAFTRVEVPASSKGTLGAATNKAEESADEMRNLAYQMRSYSKYFISNRRPVTEEEKKKAMQLANKHTSTRPHFYLVMKATSVSKLFSLSIPKDWASCHIPEGICRVELRIPPNRERWTVRLLQTKQGCRLTKGWYKFVLDNNLEQDDACVFEISEGCTPNPNQVSLRFNVILYRVVDEIVPLTQLLRHK